MDAEDDDYYNFYLLEFGVLVHSYPKDIGNQLQDSLKQCQSMLINTDKNPGIDLKCRLISGVATSCDISAYVY